MKNKILHLSFDYAEEYSENNVGKSTTVISDFIRAISAFTDNDVISLKRITNPLNQEIKKISEKHYHIISFGLPFGIFLKRTMVIIFKKILDLCDKYNFAMDNIDIIHCHKLTFEGIAGYYLAKRLNKKLFVSIRQTDFFVLKYRKDLIPLISEILSYSSKVFFIAPYMKFRLIKIFGENFYNQVLSDKLVFLPNKIETSNFSFNYEQRTGNYLSVLWFYKKAVKRKNVLNLFKAIKSLDDDTFRLDLIGAGEYLDTVKKWAKDLRIENKINFIGFKKNNELEEYFINTKGFILPSHSESFGVVYAESLVCGAPILYTLGTGFDGLFENVGPKVNSKSVKSIAEGIKDLIELNDFYRTEIRKLFEQGAFNIFSKEYSYEVYAKSTKSLL
ncbi:MAG: glycosyltransferase [Ignavibacterium sp.]|jgi:glycosyltransferase involved in cell wall biosynthesis|nr:glycosyltransferase [Ignavibacterium sp.]